MVIMRYNILCFVILSAMALGLPCRGADMPQTPRTKGLVKELLVKLDSTDVYTARKEAKIDAIKAKLPGSTDAVNFDLCFDIAEEYSNYVADSASAYLERAARIAEKIGSDSLLIRAQVARVRVLSVAGFYAEAHDILESVPRKSVTGDMLVNYYEGWVTLYHGLYSGPDEPADFKKKYRDEYNIYRDSLLEVADPMSEIFLRNMEKKEARAGHFAEARRYNAIRASMLKDRTSRFYATRIYDRFAIAYNYEHNVTGEAIDDLLESAIIEVENSNQDIASLLRVEEFLTKINEVKAAKKVSDYYYSTMRKFGSRKRRLEGLEQTMLINDRNHQSLQKRKNEIQAALAFISLLVIVLVFLLLKINSTRHKISRLNGNLQQSDKISKGYVGVVFQLYSSYIKRLDVFRTKIHSSLKKGNVERALELTSPSSDITSEEMKELYHNFDSAFVDIFPDFIQAVNDCLKPESRIVPKKTEILTTELRILALIKLGIGDSTKIAEMLHCSVKTVYNLRSGFKARLAIPEKEFKARIIDLL